MRSELPEQAEAGGDGSATAEPFTAYAGSKATNSFAFARLSDQDDLVARGDKAVRPFDRVSAGASDPHFRRQDHYLHVRER